MKLERWISLFKEDFRAHLSKKPALWIAAVLIAGFLAFYLDTRDAKVVNAKAAEDAESAATYIPEGFVLVPIEVANFESLDSILGKYGIVDLYLPARDEAGAPKQRPRKIAERVRILRAPLNPSHFAVLVSESESPRLVTHEGPFTVVVQRPSTNAGTKFVYPGAKDGGALKKRVRSRIEINGVNDG